MVGIYLRGASKEYRKESLKEFLKEKDVDWHNHVKEQCGTSQKSDTE